jgi:hypothetical protein
MILRAGWWFNTRKMVLLTLMVCIASAGLAQEKPLAAVIDIHVHSAPDSTPRSVDATDLARLAKAQGIGGLVLKNHHEPTASLAYIVRRETGILALDRQATRALPDLKPERAITDAGNSPSPF